MKINGLETLATYGVGVSKTTGHLDPLKPKTRTVNNWEDEHGEDVSLVKTYYQAREIKVDCFIHADNKSLFKQKLSAFLTAINGSIFRLSIDNINKDYFCYFKDTSEFKLLSTWNDTGMTGSFTLTFVEPHPVNKEYKATISTNGGHAFITITSVKDLWINWGDNSALESVSGTSQTKTHTYTTAGIYYVLIYGNVEDATFVLSSVLPTGTVQVFLDHIEGVGTNFLSFIVNDVIVIPGYDSNIIVEITSNTLLSVQEDMGPIETPSASGLSWAIQGGVSGLLELIA